MINWLRFVRINWSNQGEEEVQMHERSKYFLSLNLRGPFCKNLKCLVQDASDHFKREIRQQTTLIVTHVSVNLCDYLFSTHLALQLLDR